MDRPHLDYAGLFDASPNPYLVLDRSLNIAGANRAYLAATRRELADIVGRWAWDAFPADPETVRQSVASFERVLRTGEPDTMALLRFDIPRPEAEGGGFEERWWSIVHAPVLDAAGEVAWVLQHPIDVTELKRLRDAAGVRLAPAHSGIFERAGAVHEANLGLKAESERLRGLFERAPGFMCVLRGPEHRFELANAAYVRLVGGRDVLGAPVREALPELEGQGFFELLDRVYATGETFVGRGMELALRAGAGTTPQTRFVDFVYQPITDPDGRVSGIFVEGGDVTERTRAEARLRESEARLARLLALTPAGIAEFDADGRLTYANPAAERTLGAGPGGLVDRHHGDPAWQTATQDGVPIPPAHLPIARALRGEAVLDHEHAVTTLDGRRAVLLIDAVPVRDADGRVEGALAAFQDVTARHEAARALRESEARFRASTDAMPQMVWSARPDGHHDYFNRRWYEYTGVQPGEADGEAWRDLFHPDDLARAVPAWRRSLATGEPYEVEYRLRHADGAWRWCLGRALPVRDGQTGAVLRWFGTCTDVQELVDARETMARSREELEARVAERTAELRQALDRLHAEVLERERAEDALRQSQKMEAVGQLTGGIAHDFNNMLQGIGGALELARRRVAQGRAADAERFMDAAGQGVARAAALTHRLLAFARRQALDPKPVEPDGLVRGMAELIRRAAGPAISVESRAGDVVWPVLCDPGQLENALLNLAINARDAMPDGGRLTISTEGVRLTAVDVAGQEGAAPGDHVEIGVADTGTGMDEATRARAFEPFFTTKPIGQGTGLGLSQIYGFVRQSGGFVRLDSAPGRGTAVRLYLPRHEPAPGHGARPAETAEPGEADAGEAVLLVEDEAGIRAVAAERLRELGYAVLEAGDGPAALRLLRSGARADVLVTDVGLPGGMNGRQMADAARELRPGLPVLFITGYAGEALGERLPSGMEVIGKPFALDALAAKVRAMLEASPAA